MVNVYTQTWFDLFLETQAYTEQEILFVMRNLPNPPFTRVLDIGCGPGRHSGPLTAQGYEIVGIDLNSAALAKARRNINGTATYIKKDMRHLQELPGTFDAAVSLWQSFGYFEEATNQNILKQISNILKSKGRLILDIYHRKFLEKNQGIRQIKRQGVSIIARHSMQGDRLTAHLDYGNGEIELLSGSYSHRKRFVR